MNNTGSQEELTAALAFLRATDAFTAYDEKGRPYSVLSRVYKELVTEAPWLHDQPAFDRVYNEVRERLVPKVPKNCVYCDMGMVTHFHQCPNAMKEPRKPLVLIPRDVKIKQSRLTKGRR